MRHKNKLVNLKVYCFILMLLISDAFPQNFWIECQGPLTTEYPEIHSLLRTQTGTVLAGGMYGVVRSLDNCQSWINSNLSSINIQTLAKDSSGAVFAGTSNGVYYSTDDGINWEAAAYDVFFLASSIAAGQGGYVFAAAEHDGIYRSSDGGISWGILNKQYYIRTIIVTGQGIVFACGMGIYKSTNNGDTWILSGLSDSNVLSITSDSSGCLFAAVEGTGIARSTNNGGSWDVLPTSLKNTYVYSLVCGADGYLYAGTNSGFYLSTDKGDSWTRRSTGLLNTNLLSVAAVSNNLILAATYKGVYYSSDKGQNWVLTNEMVIPLAIHSFCYGPDNDIFVGSSDGVYRTTNNGDDWVFAGIGLPAYTLVNSLSYSPAGYMFAGTKGGIYRLANDSELWIKKDAGLTNKNFITIVCNSSGTLFAGTSGGLFRSTNNGENWDQLAILGNLFDLNNLAIKNDGTLFAAHGRGIYKSTDNGDNWTMVFKGNVQALTISKSQDVFCSTDDCDMEWWYSNIYRLTDSGSVHISRWYMNNARSIFRASSGKIYITSYSRTAAFNEEEGIVRQIESGLRSSAKAFFENRERYIFMGTLYGVFKSSQPVTLNDEPKAEPLLSGAYELEQNYPNPFNASTKIVYTVNNPGSVSLKVFDLTGKAVKTLAEGWHTAGKYNVEFNGSALSSGVYFCRLITEKGMSIRKLILLK